MARLTPHTERLQAQIRELETVITNFHALVENAAHIQDLLREGPALADDLMCGVRVVLESNARRWRTLAAEYAERAKSAAVSV